jgi:hypothetical protein
VEGFVGSGLAAADLGLSSDSSREGIFEQADSRNARASIVPNFVPSVMTSFVLDAPIREVPCLRAIIN